MLFCDFWFHIFLIISKIGIQIQHPRGKPGVIYAENPDGLCETRVRDWRGDERVQPRATMYAAASLSTLSFPKSYVFCNVFFDTFSHLPCSSQKQTRPCPYSSLHPALSDYLA